VDSLVEGPVRSRALAAAVRSSARPSRIARTCERHDPAVLALTWAAAEEPIRRALSVWAERAVLPVPGVSGHTLRALDLPPGPAYAEILGRIREAWLDRRVVDAESAKRLARILARRAALTRARGH
jgi:hypothetical protein